MQIGADTQTTDVKQHSHSSEALLTNLWPARFFASLILIPVDRPLLLDVYFELYMFLFGANDQLFWSQHNRNSEFYKTAGNEKQK